MCLAESEKERQIEKRRKKETGVYMRVRKRDRGEERQEDRKKDRKNERKNERKRETKRETKKLGSIIFKTTGFQICCIESSSRQKLHIISQELLHACIVTLLVGKPELFLWFDSKTGSFRVT